MENKRKQIKIQKKNERKLKREHLLDEDFDLGRSFELATADKIYVTALNLHETIS